MRVLLITLNRNLHSTPGYIARTFKVTVLTQIPGFQSQLEACRYELDTKRSCTEGHGKCTGTFVGCEHLVQAS